MGPSAWPGMEISPTEERLLLRAARLRRFGVNYLQDAICPGLELFAHQDGSHVRLLAISSRRNQGLHSGDAHDGIVANIDLEAGRSSQHSDSKGERVGRGQGGIGRGEPVSAFEGTSRGLSWAPCIDLHTPAGDVVSISSDGGSKDYGSMVDAAQDELLSEEKAKGAKKLGQDVVVGVVDDAGIYCGGSDLSGGGGSDGLRPSSSPSKLSDNFCGERVCHIAVACGSDVRLWKVSRVTCGPGTRGTAGTDNSENRRYRYSTVKVLPDWHGTTLDSSDCRESTNSLSAVGSIRCISFRPFSDGSSGPPLAATREVGVDAVPLAAWYDVGAAVFKPMGSRMMLPSPVPRKRSCGTWSGCGRRLVVSSGGEIRVYNSDPSEESVRSGTTTAAQVGECGSVKIFASDEQPTRTRSAPTGGNDPVQSSSSKEAWGSLLVDGERNTTECSTMGDSTNSMFRTVLCVEAAMYEGGVISSPGSSPGGTPTSSSPSSRQATVRPCSRRGVSAIPGSPNGLRRHENATPSSGDGDAHPSLHAMPSSAAATVAVPMRGSSLPILVGDMRTMCSAGPLAFYGTTDGGLGLDSVLASTGTRSASEILFTENKLAVLKPGGNERLGSVNSGYTSGTASSGTSGGGVEKPTRRSGFRHVLPGENWLAGSLRPSSKRLPDTPPMQQDVSNPDSSPLQLESTPVLPVSRDNETNAVTLATQSVVGASGSSLISLPSRTTAASEVIDLRGKLGRVPDGGTGSVSAASTHPLFRLSLTDSTDPIIFSPMGSSCIRRKGDIDRVVSGRGASSSDGQLRTNTIDDTAPVRRPRLVRVSCRNSNSGSRNDGVGVKTLASLPPELASPDLLASSEDGRLVAVGSHACDQVACFRLELRTSDSPHTTPSENFNAKESADPTVGSAPLDATEGGRLSSGGGEASVHRSRARRKRRQRRAVPLCTLRLPPGYRAKGLTFVKKHSTAGGSDTYSVNPAMPRGSSNEADRCRANDMVAEEVLVLGGHTVADAEVSNASTSSSSQTGSWLPGDSHRRGSSSFGDSLYRTVLLRFILPSTPSVGPDKDPVSPPPPSMSPRVASGRDEVGGGGAVGAGKKAAPSPSPGDASQDAVNSCSSRRTSDMRHHQLPSTTMVRGGEVVRNTGVSASGSPLSNTVKSEATDGEATDGEASRLAAIVLDAVARVEQRMNDRFSRLEGMLSGVCDRLAALEEGTNCHPGQR